MAKLVSNTSPLIALSIVGQLHLLWELYDQVVIPNAVFAEITAAKEEVAFGKNEVIEAVHAGKIQLYEVSDKLLVDRLYGKLHHGELETIVGGMELQADFVLLDERAARNVAKTLFLTPIGTVGILRLAKQQGKLEKVKPFLDILLEKEYRLSKRIYEMTLELEGER